MRSGRSRYGEGDLLSVPGIRKDGSRISLEFTIVPVLTAQGGIEGVVAVIRDVSQRFEEMRRLKQQVTSRSSPATNC
jgi:PAS domain S-box-containing protein